jgi:hypothetical protein
MPSWSLPLMWTRRQSPLSCTRCSLLSISMALQPYAPAGPVSQAGSTAERRQAKCAAKRETAHAACPAAHRPDHSGSAGRQDTAGDTGGRPPAWPRGRAVPVQTTHEIVDPASGLPPVRGRRAGQRRPRSRRTRIAALWPAAPMTEPAGWQPAEHEYSPAIGVTYGSRSAKPNPLST